MSRRRIEGYCRICGSFGQLSYEHVPPEKAFNGRRVVQATMEQMLAPTRWDGTRGKQLQRGGGAYTLCVPCNSNTGGWYGTEYVEWAQQGLERLARIEQREDPVFVGFRGRPLRFLKQVVTMFFSVNSEDWASRHPQLVKFVLDKNARRLPTQYSVDLVLVRGPYARSAGMFGMVEFATGRTEIATEVAHYPFAFRLFTEQSLRPRHGAIEHFADFGLEERREVWLYTIAGHVATKSPGDYRSPERVDREAAEAMAGETGG